MTTEQNKAVVRRFFEAFEANDQDALNEVLAPNLVAYSHGGPGPRNREAIIQGIDIWNAAFSEGCFTVEDLIAEGDRVATRTTLRAIHSGVFQGQPPTGKQIVLKGHTVERLRDGRIVERWVLIDQMGLMQQLGHIPPPSAG
jgi:steroid delta-isomerase-like uncharacterized protein